MEVLTNLIYLVVGLVIGAVASYFLTRKYFEKQLRENPPVTEKMIRAMFLQMGRKPSEAQIKQYLGKISGPLLDRIDLHIEVPAVKYQELTDKAPAESSKEIKKRVERARQIQKERFKNDKGVYCNAQMTEKMVATYCALGEQEELVLKQAFDNLGLSARAHNRILKVARTIADLKESKDIGVEHIAQAIYFRSLDRKYW